MKMADLETPWLDFAIAAQDASRALKGFVIAWNTATERQRTRQQQSAADRADRFRARLAARRAERGLRAVTS